MKCELSDHKNKCLVYETNWPLWKHLTYKTKADIKTIKSNKSKKKKQYKKNN